MTMTYSYAKAKQGLDLVLKKASRYGKVKIRKDKELFIITPQERDISPLDVEGVDVGVSVKDILSCIHESRKA